MKLIGKGGSDRGWVACLLILVVWFFSADASAANRTYDFDIPAADASTGLSQFAQQSNTPLIFLSDDVRDRRTNRVSGTYAFEDALALLLKGTGIEGVLNENGVLTVSTAGPEEAQGGKEMQNKQGFFANLATIIFAATAVPAAGQAQAQDDGPAALEEVVVTAQRRVQSLQEVPISIEVFSGEEIDRQGYRTMEDLSRYSPSVNIESGVQTQEVTIRGFGTTGNSLTLNSATPLFVDGIHFGRPSMIKNAFLDTERVEVLKGPQPLYFGMNATAGAFNIESRKPTQVWEGNLTGEYGNDGRKEISGAVGGPLTETLGIRLAAIGEQSDGPAKNRTDPTQKVSGYENLGGRIILQWTPNDKFRAMGKFEISQQRRGSELYTGCLTEGAISGYADGRGSPLDGGVDESLEGQFGGGEAVWALPPKGIPFRDPIVRPVEETGEECFRDKHAFSREGPYLPPPFNVTGEASRVVTAGAVDMRAAADAFLSADGPGGPGSGGTDTGGIGGRDNIDTWHTVLDLTYRLDNGVNINSETGYVKYYRNNVRDQSYDPFLSNFQGRQEDIYQYSQQIRLESPAEGYDLGIDFGGGVNLEFMVGGFWQYQTLDAYSSLFKDNVRRGQRINKIWEDSEWFAGFWNVTFNLMDRQLSISAGGRYTDVSKDAFIRGSGAQWIFDTVPCDSDGTDADPATCTPDPDFKRVDPSLTSYTHIDPITGNGAGDREDHVRIDSPLILLEDADLDNLWAASYFNDTRVVPLNWRGPFNGPVGLTEPTYGGRNGPFGSCGICLSDLAQSADNYDSQVVISFTPNALDRDHTFYGKYAEAFKGPVSDTGLGSIADSVEDMTFLPEYVTAWEVGAKGQLMDNRVRYDVALFTNEFKDLQTFVASTFSTEFGSVSLNAGRQKVDGLEFSLASAVSQNLTVNVAGAIMDGNMRDFDGGGCSGNELIAASIDAVENPAGRSVEELETANEILDELGPTRRANLPSKSQLPEELFINGGCRLEDETLTDGTVREAETIDRSGEVAARTPNYKFIFGLNYTRPIFDGSMFFLDAKAFYRDEMISDGETYSREVMFPSQGDINVSLGFGADDGKWRLTGFARNILRATKSYDSRYDLDQGGYVVSQVPQSSFTSYGIRFEYNFFR